MYTPDRSIKIICATAVLHNICVTRHIPLPEEPDVDPHDDADDNDDHGAGALTGIQIRNRLVRETFARPADMQ